MAEDKNTPPSPKRIRFVSDLHLGHPKAFFNTAEQYQRLIENCDELVVCGDFSETRPCPYLEQAQTERQAFEQICSRQQVKLTILAGNHDPEEQQAIASFHQGAIIALHGHQLFPEVAPWGREYLYNKKQAREIICSFPEAEQNLEQCLERARAMSQFVPPIIKAETKGGSSLIRLVKNVFSPPTRAFRIIWAWLTMRHRIKRFTKKHFPQARLICYGHFHLRDIFSRKNCLYINTGASFKHSRAYAVDVLGDAIEVRELTSSGIGKTVTSSTLNQL